jgi:hypothetical protein
LQRTDSTPADRHRAREKLAARLHGTEAQQAMQSLSSRVTSLLRYEALPLETAESLLWLLVEHRTIAGQHSVALVPALAQSLRTLNPEVRGRIQKTLVLLAADAGKALPDAMQSWTPSKQDSMQEVEERIREWGRIWAGP